MKLIIAVVHDHDADALFRALAAASMRATRIASSGGYLRTANATVFIGVEDEQVAQCRQIVEQICRRRMQGITSAMASEFADLDLESIAPVQRGGGVVFVLPVSRFVRILPTDVFDALIC